MLLILFYQMFLLLFLMVLVICLNYIIIMECSCLQDNEGSWSIGLVYGTDPFHMYSPSRFHNDSFPCILNPIISCNSVNDVIASFVADPFLYMHNNNNNSIELYVFFEVKNRDKSLRRGQGQIGCAVSKDYGQSWSYLQIVLKLDPNIYKWTHLSYPFIFNYNNNIYLLPQQWGKLILFKAKEFPIKWEQESILSDIAYIDPNIIYYKNQYYLIGFISSSNAHFLHILYSKDSNNPLGPYIDTPFNCKNNFILKDRNEIYNISDIKMFTICNDVNNNIPHKVVYTSKAFQHVIGIRPGGSIFYYKNELYRFVQNSYHSYGDNLDLYKIITLSKTEKFKEILISEFNTNFRNLKFSNIGLWNSVRYHHLDIKEIKINNLNYWIGVMDGDSQVDRGGKETDEALNLLKLHNNKLYLLADNDKQIQLYENKCKINNEIIKNITINNNNSNNINYNELYKRHQLKSSKERNKDLCIFSAFSDNHYVEYLKALEGIIYNYPCNKIYIYDLGIKEEHLEFLKNNIPNINILSLQTKNPYFEYKACVFKPTAILNIIDNYNKIHNCIDILYMDTSIRFKKQFDEKAYNELDRIGILAESPSTLYSQLAFTHPDMYKWFNIDREKDYEENIKYFNTSLDHYRLMQIQAGLMLINSLNKTIRNNLFIPWNECAENNKLCLSPNGYRTHWASAQPTNEFMIYNKIPVFRAHRDDQSAFTFLMNKNFGHGYSNIRGPTYLNDYVYPGWHTRSNENKLKLIIQQQLKC